IAAILYSYNLSANVTGIYVMKTGSTGQYLQAGTVNNPVLHFKVSAPGGDTLTYLGVYNSLDSWYVGSAAEGTTISENGIKVWYSEVDTNDFSQAAPVYVTHLPADISDSTWWHNTFSRAVADGSHIWVTADINETPEYGTIEMQTENVVFAGSAITSADEPADPYILLVTSVTPAENLLVKHIDGSVQSTVSTGQAYVTPVEILLYNDSPLTSADISVNSIYLKLQTYPAPGTLLPPSSIISSIRIQDKNQGTIFGELPQAMIPSLTGPFSVPLSQLNIPAGMTVTASVILTITDNTAAADTEFIISIDSENCFEAYDYYTSKAVHVSASPSDITGFPMLSKQTKIQKKLLAVSALPEKILPDPKFINKGSTNVNLLRLVMENPGDTSTASAEVYGLKFYLFSESGASLVPRDLFSRVSVTDESGNVKYRVKSSDSIEASGNTLSLPFTSSAFINAAESVTLLVSADISSQTVINNFRLVLASAGDIQCRDKNSFAAVPVTPSTATPFYSSLNLLSSSFTLSYTALMPQAIYSGQPAVPAISLVFSSPLAFGSGNILVRGMTLTARDSSGSPVDFNAAFSSVSLSSSAWTQAYSPLPASSSFYFNFPSPLTVTASPTETLLVSVSIRENTAVSSANISLLSGQDMSAYQDSDPGRRIYIAPAEGISFPMGSGTGFLSGSSAGISLSAYPSPFVRGSSCRIAYYLSAPSKVTVRIFDLFGRLVRTAVNETEKPAGSRTEDAWDGNDAHGKPVISGVYIVSVTAEAGGKKNEARTRVIYKK
ncbi:MAG TPA: FlgD immunoglobulin-like domain containing protein, partial [Candidatus Goldiibacteriota bacterium]|nr:FlgD immunoglobulin-like domain containing protein [Candidatus Goldiibacteriota bacterium]